MADPIPLGYSLLFTISFDTFESFGVVVITRRDPFVQDHLLDDHLGPLVSSISVQRTNYCRNRAFRVSTCLSVWSRIK